MKEYKIELIGIMVIYGITFLLMFLFQFPSVINWIIFSSMVISIIIGYGIKEYKSRTRRLKEIMALETINNA